jgi:hypothetical protein
MTNSTARSADACPRRHILDLVILTFLLTSVFERFPIGGQVPFVFGVMLALSQAGAAFGRGDLGFLGRLTAARRVRWTGVAALTLVLLCGAIEGVYARPAGETLNLGGGLIAGSTALSFALGIAQWAAVVAYVLALCAWLVPYLGARRQ